MWLVWLSLVRVESQTSSSHFFAETSTDTRYNTTDRVKMERTLVADAEKVLSNTMRSLNREGEEVKDVQDAPADVSTGASAAQKAFNVVS